MPYLFYKSYARIGKSVKPDRDVVFLIAEESEFYLKIVSRKGSVVLKK
jgi:hypothetical protein